MSLNALNATRYVSLDWFCHAPITIDYVGNTVGPSVGHCVTSYHGGVAKVFGEKATARKQ